MESTVRQQSQGYPSEDKELQSPPAKRKYANIKQYHQAFDEASKSSRRYNSLLILQSV